MLSEKDNHADDLMRLRMAVEQELGQRMLSPKDFVYLSERIAQRTHQHIGVNTLKRIWGHLDDNVTPRLSTLNVLAQFAGTDGWESFCQASTSADKADASAALATDARDAEVPPTAITDENQPPRKNRFKMLLILVAAVVLTLVGILGARQYRIYADRMALLQDSLLRASNQQYILQRGRHFDSYDDYLQLFGLTDVKEYPYFQIHPQYPYLVLWGPEYHHPHWHNDGDAARMMPTITERWEPADTIPELVALRNSELYYNGRRNRDIRLTFMKGLDGDTGFVFLGAYRFSLSQSDTTHIVWERVADEVNLLHLETLEHLRE